jgi:hypothetical protein
MVVNWIEDLGDPREPRTVVVRRLGYVHVDQYHIERARELGRNVRVWLYQVNPPHDFAIDRIEPAVP